MGEAVRRLPSPRWFAIMIAVALLPLFIRLLYMSEVDSIFRSIDVLGAIRDIAVGILAALLLVILRRTHVLLFVAAASFWLAANFAYYEFLAEYGSPYFLVHAAFIFDSAFFFGSAVAVTHPVLVVVWLLVLIFGVNYLAKRADWPAMRPLMLAAVAFVVVVELLPDPPLIAPWRQRDFVYANLSDVATRELYEASSAETALIQSPGVASVFKSDLDGASILPPGYRSKHNVLIVLIEGANGGSLPSNAALYGLDNQISMERLDAIARDNLSFSRFVSSQRQSNRGIYATLCGDLPRLARGVARMTEVANGMTKSCLPQVLRSNGYQTLFLNGADLTFMLMDQFMRRAGINVVLGEKDFARSVKRTKWGVVDEDLYAKALTEIETLNKSDKPWFATLFTISTHHPFEVPDSFALAPGETARERAWRYADQSIATFIDDLREAHVLDDTLVLIMGDEAGANPEKTSSKPPELEDLIQNWGLLVMLTPERIKARNDAYFQQPDIAVSVLDYLGLASERGDFIGRSLFRTYDEPRPLFFANVYSKRVYELDEKGLLTDCDAALLTDCRYFDTSGPRLFSREVRQIEVEKSNDRLKGVLLRTLAPLPSPLSKAMATR